MRVEVKFHDLTLDDLRRFARHAKEVVIDGDKGIVIFIEPDEWLIEELESRGELNVSRDSGSKTV